MLVMLMAMLNFEADAEPKPEADAGPTCEVTPVTPLTGVLISKKLAGSAVPSPWVERIWGRLTGHAPCRLFFDFDGPGRVGVCGGSGPVPCDDGLDDILDVDADGAKDFARIVVVRDVLGHVFECEETKPWIEYHLGLGLDRLICRDVDFLVHIREREAGDLVDQDGLDLVDLVGCKWGL